jgi:hypothetical protein
VKTKPEIDLLIEKMEEELARLNTERAKAIEKLKNLRSERAQIDRSPSQLSLFSDNVSVSNDSSEDDKIALFRSLFRGREDVYPRRFESAKTGRSGYQPACQNEWVRGICKKPKIKCRDCDNKSYLPVTDQVLRNHLMGFDPLSTSAKDFIIGVYPLLVDET